MADIVQLKLLENKSVIAEINGKNYAYEGGYRLVAGEKKATKFEIVSIPKQYESFQIRVEMTNAQGETVIPEIKNNRQFILPDKMAVAGYGSMCIKAIQDNTVIVWVPLKLKIWDNDWKPNVQAPALIKVGKTTTNLPNSNASVTNVGTDKYVILDFIIPKGQSAYEAALKNGFIGTEKQWLESLKGDPGIGNATLSNTDGDSTVNGFTQAAVKGIAQANNYYDLGVHDSFVSNGNGTGTVPRKTGYLSANDLINLPWSIDEFEHLESKSFFAPLGIGKPFTIVHTNLFIGYATTGIDTVKGNPNAWISGLNNLNIYPAQELNTVDDFKQYILQNDLSIEYELQASYEDKVIDGYPIRYLDRKGESWLRKEWLKGVNLLNDSVVRGQVFPNYDQSYLLPLKITAGTYTSYISVGSGIANTPNVLGLYLRRADGTNIKNISNQARSNTYNTFTVSAEEAAETVEVLLYYNHSALEGATLNGIMISEGVGIYPYQPYSGDILRKKDLPLFITATNENPAQTIGGDWEDKGTVTTSDNTVLHVYRRL